jgi:hypothetical protein
MAREFELNLTPLRHLINRSPAMAARGAQRAMGDVKDDWVREARDIAPLDTGNLRQQINGAVEPDGINSAVVVTANATARSGGGNFNYAYYIHEGQMAADGKRLRYPGTVEQFLDESAESNKQRYMQMLENEIKEELRRGGW